MKTTKFIETIWMKAIVSLLASCILGVGGIFLYFNSTCWFTGTEWSVGNNCADYNPWGISVAYVLLWPIFLMQKIFFGSMRDISDFGPLVFGKCGWLALWFYYYFLTLILVKLFYRKKGSF